jgi:ubiquitin-protein ligase
MNLTPTFPHDSPKVRFLTPIYHPNVGKDGKKK